jgi:hypothetical protein
MKSLSILAAFALLAAPPALADWKSFFHGEPAPFVKAPPPKELAEVSSVAGTTPDAQVESFMRTLASALMARDAAPVLKRLSDRYAVEGAPEGMMASGFMAQAVGKMRGPTKIVVRSVAPSGGVRVATTEFHYGADKVNVKTFRFDASGNLLSSDLFALARG